MTLEELTRHALYPFQDFRENDASFLLLELYWTLIVEEALAPWPDLQLEPLQAADQDRDHWGNPTMLRFWAPALRRSVRILLLENEENLPLCRELQEKFNCFPFITLEFERKGITDPFDEVDQLRFRADVSSVSMEAVLWGIRYFIGEEASIESMEDAWDRYLVESGNGPTRAMRDEWYQKYLEEDDDDEE